MMPLIASVKERENSNASRKMISSSVTRLPSSLGSLMNPKAAQIELKHKVSKNLNRALNMLT
jgi:hypothetical protein